MISGAIKVELTSADLEGSIAFITENSIEMKQVNRISELACSFFVRRSDYAVLSEICKIRGETLRICNKYGLFWTGKALLRRPVFLTGFCILLLLVLMLPTRVLFVRIEGNQNVPDKKILEAAEACGICFGASRREVKSEKTKNALLSKIEELQWAGVNTSGCVAVISVRERSEAEKTEQNMKVASIVAARDGYVLSTTTIRGNSLVRSGQSVKEGQVLISGYTDCGLCIQATKAEGEIQALTIRNFEAVYPGQYMQNGRVLDVKRKYSILIRKKRINLWKDSGISEGSCGRMYEEYYITLPGGFRLPFALCIEEYVSCEMSASRIPQVYAQERLAEFADSYLSQQMVAGKILNAVQTVTHEDGSFRLKGNYACTEMIGKLRQEQIGDTNGKVS